MSRETLSRDSADDLDMAVHFKLAVCTGDAQKVRSLIQAGMPVDHPYSEGLTALHFAALHNHIDVVRTLIYFGANVTAVTTDSGRVTPVGLADLKGHQEIVDIICKHPPVKYPLKRRCFGPLVITAVAAVNIGVGLYFVHPSVQWNGDDCEHAVQSWQYAVVFSLIFVFFVSLALVNFLDPGAVERKDVAYVSELRALPEDELVVVTEECFMVGGPMRRSDGAVLANSGNHRKCPTVRSASGASSGLTTIARLSGIALGLATTASLH
eukprot:CAMPEP_0194487134 /NCGR_PEP_ID=MMETSP0253-20130528/7526_1 /TAXON_ID=2966 /ORGANISM="Noctiluca scintillans" /LENGTH=266 /DNA_ID=CAMNT_0039327309 /DNA_START=42 /DNA_END=843 /DNA_ORIENTATION=+